MHSFLLLVAQTIFMAVGAVGLSVLTGSEEIPAQPGLWAFLFMVGYLVVGGWLIVRIGILRFSKQSWSELGWRTRFLGKDILIGILGFLILLLVFLSLGSLFDFLSWQEFLERQESYTFAQRLLFLVIGLQAGLIEESVFRGHLQPKCIDRFGLVVGVLIVAIVFAFYHLNFHLISLIGKMVLGLGYGVLRGRNNSLWRPATAHMLTWVVLGTL